MRGEQAFKRTPVASTIPSAGNSPTTEEAVASGPKAGSKARGRTRRFVITGVALAVTWWVLNPGDTASWVIGGPAVIVAAASTLLFPTTPSYSRSFTATVRFAGYFGWQSVVGATDVALKALNPFFQPEPAFIEWCTRLPEGAPRQLLANAITLLPGTLTARLEDDRLTIHLLDSTAEPGLGEIEDRIAALFRVHEKGAP